MKQDIFLFSEQDRGLEELSKIIGRQREMAQAIGDEVESQNGTINIIILLTNLKLNTILL